MPRSSLPRIAWLPLCFVALLPFAISCSGGVQKIGGVRSEIVVTAGDTVTALAFAPDGRLFLTEQNSGNIRIVTAEGQLLAEPFAELDPAIGLEWGVLGIAIDPAFDVNHYVYIYYTQPDGPEPDLAMPVVIRFTDDNDKGVDPTVIAEFPRANPEIPTHVAGGIHFGPDGYLYISIGDTERQELPQDLSSPFGKILRVTREGDPAPENPFIDEPRADPRVYAYGLRNTFAFTFDPESGRIYANDNGPSNCDELNIIEAGGNYGWPESLSTEEVPCENPGAIEPIYHYTRAGKKPQEISSNAAPTGIAFVSGQVYPALGDGLVTCALNTGLMRRLSLAEPDRDEVADDSVVVENCDIAVAVDPAGIIYYSTRTEIYRLLPQ